MTTNLMFHNFSTSITPAIQNMKSVLIGKGMLIKGIQ